MIVEQKTTQENQSSMLEGNLCKEILFQDSLDSIGWTAAFIWAGILFGLGTGWGLIWPLILIAIGVSILKDINLSQT